MAASEAAKKHLAELAARVPKAEKKADETLRKEKTTTKRKPRTTKKA